MLPKFNPIILSVRLVRKREWGCEVNKLFYLRIRLGASTSESPTFGLCQIYPHCRAHASMWQCRLSLSAIIIPGVFFFLLLVFFFLKKKNHRSKWGIQTKKDYKSFY